MQSVLDAFIAPTTQQEFFAHHWGRDYLLARQSAVASSQLFSWEALYEVLSTQRFEYPRLRLVRAGKVVPSEAYVGQYVDRRGRQYTSHVSNAVDRLLKAGNVLHITSVGETWKPLASIAAKLEVELDARVQVNLHAGFAASKGFDVHWDGHDVFAVQLEGRKRWRLFGFTEEAPLAVPPDQKKGAPTASAVELTLVAGDVLYIPRGYWHAAEALDEPSLHLSFAAQHPCGLDFLGAILKTIVMRSAVRKDLPRSAFGAVAGLGTSKEEYLATIKAALDGALSVDSLDQFVAEYRESLGSTNHVDFASIESNRRTKDDS